MKKIYLLLVLLLSNMRLYACPPPNIPDEYQVRCDPLDMSADGELMLFHDMSPERKINWMIRPCVWFSGRVMWA
ncbi:hypothetical protein [Alysiella crassa]|uniref:Uncharacterized protein n=1 Tax=Alysiella crassa TaxID=153491 RepID=A0A376BLL5_9NEIS|nr:hypothetical protein [Alysiella crassa]UOP07662.1 hypothetical protein LVJ80_04675 [Alysiella crassa]SSY70104.1 Uncharacterised protein [Alysiella crassa]